MHRRGPGPSRSASASRTCIRWAGDDAETLVAERERRGPFLDVADLARRRPVSRDALEALVAAAPATASARGGDLLWELGARRSAPAACRARSGEAKQLALPLGPTVETPDCPTWTRWERMLADYRHTGLSVGMHPLELLRPHLPEGTLSSEEPFDAPHGATRRLRGHGDRPAAPATANGIVFMLLEDELGQVNLIVPPAVYERHRAVVRGSRCCSSVAATSGATETGTSSSPSSSRSPLLARRVGEGDVAVALPRAHHFGHR